MQLDREDWPDWRGVGRDAVTLAVPAEAPKALVRVWSRPMPSPAMAGIAVSGGRVVVAGRDAAGEKDLFHCLDAETGDELWTFSYAAVGDLDYTNTPRATPVIHDGRLYLLGAFGHFHCLDLATGQVLWQKHFADELGGEVPMWGWSSTPLIVGQRLIINPGSETASIVAVDRVTGETVWQEPGEPAGYASFIAGVFGGVEQVIGYDGFSLGGWDLADGERLWEFAAEHDGDFNVPTPIDVGGRLLLATENNGTRLYEFDDEGRMADEPVARNMGLAPDMSTPVVTGGLVIGYDTEIRCLDLEAGLELLWSAADPAPGDYCTFVAGNGNVLVVCNNGEIVLARVLRDGFEAIAEWSPFGDLAEDERKTWSHPAVVGNRLFVRNSIAVYCFEFEL